VEKLKDVDNRHVKKVMWKYKGKINGYLVKSAKAKEKFITADMDKLDNILKKRDFLRAEIDKLVEDDANGNQYAVQLKIGLDRHMRRIQSNISREQRSNSKCTIGKAMKNIETKLKVFDKGEAKKIF